MRINRLLFFFVSFFVASEIAVAAPKGARRAPPDVDAGTECVAGPDTQSIRDMVKDEASRQGVDAKLALAIAEAESGSGQHLNSERGARGPMQVIPETGARYGVKDLCNPIENIKAGVSYLNDLMKEFGGNVMLVAAAYNAGPERVYAAKGIPSIAETVRFVAAVTNAYSGFGTQVSRKSGRGVKTASVSAGDGAGKDGGGLNWIGGSVLYVDEGVRDEK